MAGLALVSGSRAVAEDAVQEALARAWERSDRGERIESLAGWATVVATNLMQSGFRRLRVERRAKDRLAPIAAGVGSAASTHAGALGADDRVDLQRALRALPRRQRQATVLHYYLGMSIAEIAAALRVSEGTAKSALFRARHSLAVALGDEEDADAPEEANDVAGH